MFNNEGRRAQALFAQANTQAYARAARSSDYRNAPRYRVKLQERAAHHAAIARQLLGIEARA